MRMLSRVRLGHNLPLGHHKSDRNSLKSGHDRLRDSVVDASPTNVCFCIGSATGPTTALGQQLPNPIGICREEVLPDCDRGS
jgi:hypothetical protein